MECFLQYGTISDPSRSYHLEFSGVSEDEASKILAAAGSFGIVCGSMLRKGQRSVYLKDSDSIADLLTAMGASSARLKYEDIKVLREMRQSVQRRVNCETANISKTVSASIKQLEDIRVIEEAAGLDSMPQGLREVAELRIEHPDAALSDLALMMPDLGRSGINHRFRKIAAIAAGLRHESGREG